MAIDAPIATEVPPPAVTPLPAESQPPIEPTSGSSGSPLILIVLIAREESGHSLRAVSHVGDSISPHTSAMGKAILARLGPERQLAVLRNAVGPDAGRIRDELAGELETIRVHGYALDEETYSPGLRCRAAAFLDEDGLAVGGISVAGPAARFSFEKATECLPMLRTLVDELSAQSQAEQSPVAT